MRQSQSRKATNRRGQSILETGVLLLVIAATMVLMQVYLKRAVQGRMRESMDNVGGQYDFATADSEFTIRHLSSQTTLTATDTISRRWIQRPRPVIANVVVATINTETHYDNTSRGGYEIIPEP